MPRHAGTSYSVDDQPTQVVRKRPWPAKPAIVEVGQSRRGTTAPGRSASPGSGHTTPARQPLVKPGNSALELGTGNQDAIGIRPVAGLPRPLQGRIGAPELLLLCRHQGSPLRQEPRPTGMMRVQPVIPASSLAGCHAAPPRHQSMLHECRPCLDIRRAGDSITSILVPAWTPLQTSAPIRCRNNCFILAKS